MEFHERQTFARWVYWTICISNVTPVILLFVIPGPIPFGLVLVILFMVLLPIVLYLFLGVMITEIGTDMRGEPELHIAFGAMRTINYHFPISTITSAVVRKYDPIGEYGGWGIRGWRGKRALNMRGDRGVEITTTFKGKPASFMIGSQKPEELETALQAKMPPL